MANINRLKDNEISNGNVINADDIDTELNQLVNELNSKETRITDLESSAMSISGVKTFVSIPVLPASDPTTANQATRKAYVDAGIKNLIVGCVPAYASANTITIGAGVVRDSTNAYNLTVSSPLTVSMAGSGALGLVDGTDTTNQWVYVYIIGKTDGTVSAVFSTTNESVSGAITLPSGYTLRRQLPIAVRNDGSSNMIPFSVGYGWPQRPYVQYRVAFSDHGGPTAGTTNVVNNTNATNFTSQSLASFVPPISRMAKLNLQGLYSSTNRSLLVTNDSAESNGYSMRLFSGGQYASSQIDMATTSSQAIEWKTGGTGVGVFIDVMGYIVTEI